jgi:hypothetical protein
MVCRRPDHRSLEAIRLSTAHSRRGAKQLVLTLCGGESPCCCLLLSQRPRQVRTVPTAADWAWGASPRETGVTPDDRRDLQDLRVQERWGDEHHASSTIPRASMARGPASTAWSRPRACQVAKPTQPNPATRRADGLHGRHKAPRGTDERRREALIDDGRGFKGH